MSCTYHLAIYYILISRFVFDILFIWFSGKNSQERLKVGLQRKRMPVRIYLHRSKKVIFNCRWLSKLSSKMDLKRPVFRSFCSCSWNVVVSL